MRQDYDFSKSIRNPYAGRLKQQITMRVDKSAVEYFKNLADELGVPYQNLINWYLRDCAIEARRPSLKWLPGVEQAIPRGSRKRAA